DQIRAERDRIRQVAAEVVELAANDHAEREEIRRSLQVQLGDLEASFDEQIVVLADADFALTARITTLEASSNDLSASIQQVEQARIDGDNALASLVAAVAVGTAQQFDHVARWYFDTTVDGWTGAPNAPSASAGFLIPGAGSSVLSPSGLAASGDTYAQVRARIRRVGSPTWLGQLWWADAGQGWDAGRRDTLAEPTFSSEDIAELTWTPGWTGNIDAIRLDLADGADASNYYEIDWVAIGRPSPGASSAELLTEQQARISADSALASSIIALEADLTDAEGAITGNANAIDALEVRVTDTEAGLEAAALSISALEATVNDEETGLAAIAGIVESLTVEVGLLSDGSQYSYAEAIRNLQTSVRGVALEALNASARDENERAAVRDYVAGATQTLNTRVDATDQQVAINVEAITALDAAVLDAQGDIIANASALDALTLTVIDQGTAIDVNAAAITSLEVSIKGLDDALDTKASAGALDALTIRVTDNEDGLSALATSVTALNAELSSIEDDLETRALASALDELVAQVETLDDGSLASFAAAIRNLETVVRGVALEGLNANARDENERAVVRDYVAGVSQTLTSRIDATDGQVSINVAAITELTAQVLDANGNILSNTNALSALSVEVVDQGASIDALSSAITALEATVGSLDDELDTKASASALSALTARVTVAEGEIDTISSAVTALEAGVEDLESDLATKASASAVTSLTARVTATEDEIDVLSVAVTSLEASLEDLEDEVGTKASASAVQALTTRVTAAEGEIDTLASAVTSLGASIEDLEDDLGTKASVAALNALTVRVTDNEAGISANASAITQLTADLSDLDDELATRASASALNALSVEVSEIDGELSALASSISALESTVDDATAGTTFKMETVAGPGGYARIGMMARYAGGYGYKEAGLFIDVSSDWNTPSRVGVHADQFVIATGSGLETPFFVDGGQVFMDWARIANVSIGFGEITGALQSDNYAEVAGLPVAGFKLDRETGQIKGKEVISREILELGAATDFQSQTYNAWYPGEDYSPGWENLLVIELGPTALGDMWTIVAGGDVRLWQYTDNTDPEAPRFWLREGLLRLVRQTQPVGSAVWGPERQIVSFAIPTDSAWSDRNASEVLGGVYNNVRYALQISTRTTGDATPPSLPSNHRNLFLS
ncbi:hypothetical protein C4N9_21590, partial [Pararhodobacter marinus]